MKKLLNFIILTIIMGVLLVGCFSRTNPVYNVKNSPVREETIGSGIYSEVYRAIKEAGISTNWIIRKIKEGEAKGDFHYGRHKATIKITYDNNFFSIDYVNSTNLKYNSIEGSIHKSYNKWVQRLEKEINNNLKTLNSTTVH